MNGDMLVVWLKWQNISENSSNDIAGSSNGRTDASGASDLGPNPSPAAFSLDNLKGLSILKEYKI